jgi:PAS domain S-box-containing protein
METLRVAKDGRHIPVLLRVSPMKDADGQVIGASKVIHDITELVSAREALRLEKELLATTLTSIGDGVIVTGPEGNVNFLNPEAERLTGWTNPEAQARPLRDVFRIINEYSRQPAESPVEKALRLGIVVGLANHTILIGKNGQEVPIDDSAAPIRQPDGRIAGVVLVFRDFTEQKKAEAKLAELALLPAQNPAPILRVTAAGTLLHANPAAMDMLKKWDLKDGQPAPGELSRMAAEALETGKTSQQDLSIDNRIFLISVVPIQEHRYANLYGFDVTDRRNAVEALREAHEQLASRAVHLEKLVQQRTARLNEMIGDLEAFSYSIVHDMRGPLRAMQSFAQLLAEECQPINETAENYVRRIKTAAERMDHLIQDGLNYSRMMRAELPLTSVDAGALVQGMIETYPAFQPPEAEIEVDGKIPPVSANEAVLTQCISNLLGNAVKFVPKGVKPRVRVWGEAREGQVRLFFKDNGIGIQKEWHDRIFQIFQRLDPNYEGTGIGLAIVKKSAERMNGTAGVESTPGQGSTFWLELAAATAGNQTVSLNGPDHQT